MAKFEVTQVKVPFPEAGDLHLRIRVGACRLKVRPGPDEIPTPRDAEGIGIGVESWVIGTYQHPSGVLPARVEEEGGTVTITQERTLADIGGIFRGAPRFELALGKAKPYMLTLEVGASESSFDLGGLPVTRLIAKQGAGKADFDFSAPNPQPMSLLDVDAGAVGMNMKNLANANFAEMAIHGGAAVYKFDFGGALQRDAHVRIVTGMSSVVISVPASTAAKITTESTLSGMDVGDGFMKKEGAFWTEAALAGKTPVLTIYASISLGSLLIRTT